MSSRRRPYLNLKWSILKLFRTPAHWLKEFTSKWSIFDKPYLDQDYRGMHLDWPAPDWPIGRKWPDLPPRWTFKFDEGICWLTPINADCGEPFSFKASINLVPLRSTGGELIFTIMNSEPERVRILNVETSGSPFFTASIEGEIADDWTGTAVICISASLQAQLLRGFSVTNPYGEGPGILSAQEALSLPKLWMYEQNGWWDCGCIDVEVTCCDASALAWDSDTSATTVARNASCTIAITDAGSSGPYSWSVGGTGFTLDNATTTGLTNTLNADATACGLATITVTGCGETEAIGYVRCTTGVWVLETDDFCVNCTGCCQQYAEPCDPCTPDTWEENDADDPRYRYKACGSGCPPSGPDDGPYCQEGGVTNTCDTLCYTLLSDLYNTCVNNIPSGYNTFSVVDRWIWECV